MAQVTITVTANNIFQSTYSISPDEAISGDVTRTRRFTTEGGIVSDHFSIKIEHESDTDRLYVENLALALTRLNER
jgi:hypothetical protein